MLYETLLRPILFGMSKQDPEEAHQFVIRLLNRIQASPTVIRNFEGLYGARYNPRPVVVSGITFPNRVGLAAGFDKDAVALLALQAFGFGFIEFGSVLPRPQVGNPRPRLFRFPDFEAIFNRMGFNSYGADAVVENLKAYGDKIRIPLIGSLGKMKETDNDDAALDYVEGGRKIRPYVQIKTVNVSSPNTLGLRKLQGRDYLEALVRAVVEDERREAAKAGDRERPTYVKLAADMTEAETEEAVEAAFTAGAKGFIIGNTSIDPEIKKKLGVEKEMGGVSGRPIFLKNLRKVKEVRKLVGSDFPIIGVGGIMIPNNAEAYFDVGATLIQLYTGWIFHGNKLVQRCRKL